MNQKITGRLIYDPWVRGGRQPSRLFLHLFDKFNRARLTRESEKHPFFKYKLFDEQTPAFSFSRNSLILLFARLQKPSQNPSSRWELGLARWPAPISTLRNSANGQRSL